MQMCSRRRREMMIEPRIQMTIIGPIELPNWMLRLATVAGARNSIAAIPKLDGFQMCRPFTRSTYLDVMVMALQRAYGQKYGERTRIPTLMPEMYALARCGIFP